MSSSDEDEGFFPMEQEKKYFFYILKKLNIAQYIEKSYYRLFCVERFILIFIRHMEIIFLLKTIGNSVSKVSNSLLRITIIYIHTNNSKNFVLYD